MLIEMLLVTSKMIFLCEKGRLMTVDIMHDGQHLVKTPDNSADFVIANQVLEHYEHPKWPLRLPFRFCDGAACSS